VLPLPSGAILEKPRSKEDQMGMLNDYNGSTVSVVTGVTIGQFPRSPLHFLAFALHHIS
jgi:predicted house-cleaning NTP pyrophosphatase (Maf/HAM1 superfamily)